MSPDDVTRMRRVLRALVDTSNSHHRYYEQLAGPTDKRLGPDRIDIGCQTDPGNPSEMIIYLVEEPPVKVPSWKLEDLREEWSDYMKLQSSIAALAGYSTSLQEEGDPFGLKGGVDRHIRELLLVPKPEDLPASDEYKHCYQGSSWLKDSSHSESRPRTSTELFLQAREAKKIRQKQWKKDATATRSRVPHWAPIEEWPLWRWDATRSDHVPAEYGLSMENGPYWCPSWQWHLWKRDDERGWVPDLKAPLQPSSSSRKHGRDVEDAEAGPSQPRSKKTKGFPSGLTPEDAIVLD